MADSPVIEVEDRGQFAVVALNRPEKRNAISRQLAAELSEAFDQLSDKKAIVLTGRGPAFCAGLDLKERVPGQAWSASLGADGAQFWFETIEKIRRHPAVVIAAVNGFAVGGGLTLVNVAELAVASETAQFGVPEMGFGSFPALSGPSTIKRILPKHAAALIFTAKQVSAGRALEWGLINEVVAPDELLSRACEIAGQIAEFDARVLGFGKRAVQDLQRMEWTNAIDHGILVSAMVRRFTDESGDQKGS